MDSVGNDNRTRFSQRFQACCNIYAVAKDVIVLVDDVAKVDSDAQTYSLLSSQLVLHAYGTCNRFSCCGELNQPTVTHCFY